MFAARSLRIAGKVPAFANSFKAPSQRGVKTVANVLAQTVWKKSTVMYISYIVTGCVVLEVVYGNVTNFLWESYNYGVS
jgi:hypothetical protein